MKLHTIGQWVTAALLAPVALALVSCTTTQQGTVGGAAVGGTLGAVAGHNFGDSKADRNVGALLGAGVGALVGNQMGQQADRQKQLDQRLQAAETQANQTTVWITNSNGSKTPVVLKRGSGDTWTGPRGEVYTGMPTEAQLKSVYGM